MSVKRLLWLLECVHGYEFTCSFLDCPGGTIEEYDFDKAWDRYYEVADRRRVRGLVFDELSEIIKGGQ